VKDLVMESVVNQNWQITLPEELREALHLKEGDTLYFELDRDGAHLVRSRTRPVQSLKGIIKYSGPPRTIEDMERAISENAGR